MIYALDPGYERSALVAIDDTGHIFERMLEPNELVRSHLVHHSDREGVLVIEQIESFGMAVGREIFETVFWSGRFAEVFYPGHVERLPRRVVKVTLCHSARATDANIRQALLDCYGPGKEKAVGTKKAQGPLYGFRSDLWAALAVGAAWLKLNPSGKPNPFDEL